MSGQWLKALALDREDLTGARLVGLLPRLFLTPMSAKPTHATKGTPPPMTEVKESRAPHVALLVETSLASGRDLLRGIARYAREQGPWSLFHAAGGLEESVPPWLKGWKGDGIIARVTTSAQAARLRRTGLPVVDVLGLVPEAGFPLVRVDDAAISHLAAEHFIERGIDHIAFIGLREENWSTRRGEALRRATANAPSRRRISFHLREVSRAELESQPWEERQNDLAAWIAQLPRPCGLMVGSDQLGPDVLEACRRVPVVVPDEIAVVGVDNDEPLCDVCHPPLSSVWPDHLEAGFQAAALLHRLMRGEAPPEGAQIIAPKHVVTRLSSDVLAVDDPAVASALRLIRDQACRGISVDEIARGAGVSRSVLQRRFRARLGQTIHDYLVSARLKRAVEFLTASDLSLGDVAERCGFTHQEYMGAVFKQRLQRTPAQVRKGI
jgi:LacI family transcriptional regulator